MKYTVAAIVIPLSIINMVISSPRVGECSLPYGLCFPTNFTVTGVSSDFINTSWTMLTHDVIQQSAIEYESGDIHGNFDCIPDSPSQDITRDTDQLLFNYECQVTGLSPCLQYDLVMYSVPRDFDAGNNRSHYYSGSTRAETTPDLSIAPKNLTCDLSTPGQIKLEWLTPVDSCNDQVGSYEIHYEGISYYQDDVYQNGSDTVQETWWTLKDPLPGANFQFSVNAQYTDEDMSATKTVECTSLEEESEAPQNVSVFSITSHSVEMSWIDPGEPNGLILFYEVKIQESQVEDEISFSNCSKSPCTIDQLDECTNYEFSVAAWNSAGQGQFSELERASTSSSDLDTPTFNVFCANDTGAIRISWDNVLTNCSASSYSITYLTNVLWKPEDSTSTYTHDIGETTFYNITGEDYIPWTEYNITVSTGSRQGHCFVTSNEEKSNAPTIEKISVEESTILVSWSLPSEANGLIDSYSVEWEDEEGKAKSKIVEAPQTDTEIEDVLWCANYTVSVAAINGCCEGDKSIETISTDITGPSSAACETINSSSLSVKWTAPPQNCDEKEQMIEFGGIRCWDEVEVETQYLTLEGSVNNYELNDLLPCTTYHICISSSEIDGKTCCNGTTDQDIPTEPQNFILVDSDSSTLSFAWEEPLLWNGFQQGYIFTFAGVDQTVHDTSIEMSNLDSDTKYDASVKACTEIGCSSPQTRQDSTAKGSSDPGTDPNVGLIIGVTIGVIAVVALIVGGLVFYKRKQKRSHEKISDELSTPKMDE